VSADIRRRGTGGGEPRARARRLVRLLPAACCLLLASCDWFTDFKDQPRIEPWEAEYQGETTPFRGNPQHSVSTDGGNALAYDVSRPQYPMVMPMVIDSMAGIPNPRPISDASIENGRKYYQINCAVCHGHAGKGDGPALRYGVAAPSLVTDRAKGLSDGYYWGIMRNGRASMPNYARIESDDRWDVVHYIRGLQGTLGRTVDTTIVGAPGETGTKVPGASVSAPTVPSPFYHPAAAGRRDTTTMQQDTAAAAPAAADSARAATAPAAPGVRP
jgi:mono/diheme cytochrome c family protein